MSALSTQYGTFDVWSGFFFFFFFFCVCVFRGVSFLCSYVYKIETFFLGKIPRPNAVCCSKYHVFFWVFFVCLLVFLGVVFFFFWGGGGRGLGFFFFFFFRFFLEALNIPHLIMGVFLLWSFHCLYAF